MKNLSKALNQHAITVGKPRIGSTRTTKLLFSLCFMLCCLVFISCQKEGVLQAEDTIEVKPAVSQEMNGRNFLFDYPGLSAETQWELQQARAATARYRNIENAYRDGYQNISVVVPNMGHHFLKASLADATFDFRQPEILVYNPDHDGNFELVAVEYAVPLNLSASAPEGFTGQTDVWDENTGFGLWLLHAWVWAHNPLGVFNATNPDVHLHE